MPQLYRVVTVTKAVPCIVHTWPTMQPTQRNCIWFSIPRKKNRFPGQTQSFFASRSRRFETTAKHWPVHQFSIFSEQFLWSHVLEYDMSFHLELTTYHFGNAILKFFKVHMRSKVQKIRSLQHCYAVAFWKSFFTVLMYRKISTISFSWKICSSGWSSFRIAVG